MARSSCVELKDGKHETSSGGYCLGRANDPIILDNRGWAFGAKPNGVGWPSGHAEPSLRIVNEILNLIDNESIESISDFGAGIGQYKAAIKARLSSTMRLHGFTYDAYDGAGDIVESTKGAVQFFDLSIPLALKKSDWVMSLEVGEHVPRHFEPMVIRNLHHHNCKGIILSWGRVGQPGRQHINCHSKKYLIHVFEALGYTYDHDTSNIFRQKEDNWRWFVHNMLVFRRKHPVDCKDTGS